MASSNVAAETATIAFTAFETDKTTFARAAYIDVDAENASVATAAGDIAPAQDADFSIAALDATVTIAGENVFVNAREATFTLAGIDVPFIIIDEPAGPTYTFFAPTVDENLVVERSHPDWEFLQRLHWERGLSVVKRGGEYVTVRFVVPELLDGQTEGIHYFVGGHHYSGVPEAVALELIADGYEPELELV
jgi:hypothetical protein